MECYFSCITIQRPEKLKTRTFIEKDRKMKVFLSAIFIFLMSICYSQSILKLKILDIKNDSAIYGATVTLSQDKILFIGNSNTSGEVETVFKNDKKTNLSVTHPKYYSFERQFEMKSDTILLVIRLKSEKVQEIKEVVVKAPGAVDTVFRSSRLHVEDFAVLPNGNLMLLTYSKRLKKGSEVLLFDGQNILQTFAVPGIAEKLIQDYRGNVHVICQNRVFTLMVEGSTLKLAQLEKDYFYRYVAPILDTNGFQMYYSDFNELYPEFSYWKYDQTDTIYDKFRTIRDDLMMELYLSEYKWVDIRTKIWAKNLEYETGIDAEIWVGANYFTQSIYYKELYAPFFKVGKELLVFDYYRNQMFTHDLEGLILESSEINHHLDKKTSGWKAELMQDRKNDNIYAWYEKVGTSYLGKIDPKTGNIETKYQLNFKYLEKIQVFDNYVYYVYRPFESSQKKYLYKEKLPLDFTNQ